MIYLVTKSVENDISVSFIVINEQGIGQPPEILKPLGHVPMKYGDNWFNVPFDQLIENLVVVVDTWLIYC